MNGLVFKNNELTLTAAPMPDRPDECLVRVIRSGICSTDLEIIRGYAGFEGTIGHEFVGIVESGPDCLSGTRVVGEINVGCGICEMCRGGDERHCPRRTVLGIKGRDGAHAEYLTLPARNLFKVPDSVPTDAAVFAEPLAAAIGITEQVPVGPDTKAAVIGDGKLGILCALVLHISAPNTVLIGKHRSKLAIAAKSGVEGILAGAAGDLKGSFDVVVEASGSESGFAAALDLVRPRGKIVLKSTFQGTPAWEAWRVVVDEITIVGSRCGRFAPALELLASGALGLEGLIDDEFRLAEGTAAVKRAAEKGALKVLLNMER